MTMRDMPTTENPRCYRTFKRSCRNFQEFGSARKFTVDKNLTYDEARRQCQEFNEHRTPAQIRRGTKMEFESM